METLGLALVGMRARYGRLVRFFINSVKGFAEGEQAGPERLTLCLYASLGYDGLAGKGKGRGEAYALAYSPKLRAIICRNRFAMLRRLLDTAARASQDQ